MSWVVSRLKERSTWAGILTLATIFGVKIRPDLQELIIQLGGVIGAIIFTVTADPKTAVVLEKPSEPGTGKIDGTTDGSQPATAGE